MGLSLVSCAVTSATHPANQPAYICNDMYKSNTEESASYAIGESMSFSRTLNGRVSVCVGVGWVGVVYGGALRSPMVDRKSKTFSPKSRIKYPVGGFGGLPPQLVTGPH